jgi:hypothetical protein
MSSVEILSLSEKAVREFCKRNNIRRLALFGSVLGTGFTPESDIDVLVEFEKDKTPGFLTLARMEREFSELVGGREVDFRTPEDLSRYFRDEVIASATVLYAEG